MSSTTKPFEEKMNASVNHLIHELASIRAGRANLPVGPLDAQAHLQGHPDQRHRHQPH